MKAKAILSSPQYNVSFKRPVHALMLSSYRFPCLFLRLPPCTVSCGIILARPYDRVTFLYHFSLRLFTDQEVFILPDGVSNSSFYFLVGQMI